MLQIYCMWFLWSRLVGGFLANVFTPAARQTPGASTESLSCFDILQRKILVYHITCLICNIMIHQEFLLIIGNNRCLLCNKIVMHNY